MAGVKISQLPALPSAALTDLYATVQGGTTYKGTLTQLATLFNANLTFLPLAGGTMSGAINMGTFGITNMANPVSAQDAATKSYVDNIATGGGAPVYAATTANLNVTQSGAGVGATLTNAGTQAVFTLDGTTPPLNSRILVKNQSTNTQNGVYTLTNVGSISTNWVLTRAADYDTPADINSTGIIPVENGTANVNTGWINTTLMVTVDTTAVTFVQFGVTLPVSVANGGTGLTSAAANSGFLTNGVGVPAWVTVTGTGAPVLGTSPTISSPLINNIFDPINNLQVFAFQGVASAVNYIAVANATTGGHPSLRFIGSDTDINGDIVAQGAGSLSFYNNNGASKTLIMTLLGASVSAVNYLSCANSITGNFPSISAAGTDTNIALSLNGKGNLGVQVQGSTAGTNVTSGYVREFVTHNIAAASPTTLTSGQANDVTSISLGAGDWDVWGNILVRGTTVTNCSFWISTTSATTPDLSLVNNIAPVATSSALGMNCPNIRVNISSTTTVYLSCLPTATGTVTGCGTISARRR